ncbi:hypothetical protein N336_05829, partial [Phalacrocorax carbo]
LPRESQQRLFFAPGDCFFCFLQDLDLSYNNLCPQDVWTLGDLPQLKVLCLTANGLWSLPPDLAGSRDSAHLRFPSLEVLSLDDNCLSDSSVFVSLSQLCSLRQLNLDRNKISAVPYLHQAESRQFFLHPTLDGHSFRAEWYKFLSSLWQRPQLPQQEDTEVPAELEAKKGQLEYVVLQNDRDPDKTGEQRLPLPAHTETTGCFGGRGLHCVRVVPREGEPSALRALLTPSTRRDVCAPFPALKHLSLAFNKIADETALLPVAFFPCLKELTFHNNPLTTTRSGQPPLLTQLLQHNLGIKLVRQKSLAMERRHFSIPLKVTSHLPKVTKQPLMLKAPVKTFLWKQLPAAAAGDPRPPPGSAEEDVASFFMTQVRPGFPLFYCFEVEDASRPLPGPLAEARLEKSEQKGEGSSQVVPERYKGYEELLGGDTDPDFIEPVGIQKNVQALYNILKHPLVYRDTKPRLDSLQKPYVPRKKHRRMPGPPAQKTRAEILEGILTAMRNTSTITEIPLASVLQKRKSSSEVYREAWRLMEEFQEVFE